MRRRETIQQALDRSGVERRDFLRFCGGLMVAAPFGLVLTSNRSAAEIAAVLGAAKRPSVIWLHFQDCTGCSETLLRTSQPDLEKLLFDVISLDYHETLMAASGHQAEAALRDAMEQNRGEYVLVVEGSIPTKENGQYMKIAGRPATEILAEVGGNAAAIISIGSCASWGGLPSASPNPTGAVGVDALVSNKPIINIPGCPPNPYTFLAVVLQYATAGTLPALDALRRPLFAFDRLIHDHCPRRAHFDAGRFARQFGDEGHRQGYCLYALGCKGPTTHAACSTRHFNDIVDCWPIGIGAPCVGCTEKGVVFHQPMFATAEVHNVVPPSTYPAVETGSGQVDPVATGLVGVGVGALLGGTYIAAKRFSSTRDDESVPRAKSAVDPTREDEADNKGDPS